MSDCLWPFLKKCLPTAAVASSLMEEKCSENLLYTGLEVWPIYWGQFLQFRSCFLQVIQYITFADKQFKLDTIGFFLWLKMKQ